MRKKLILYGAGQRCRELCGILKDLDALDNLVIVDSDPGKAGSKIEGLCVETPDKIKDFCDSSLCITIADETVNNSVREKLIHTYGYQTEKLVSFHKVIQDAFMNNGEIQNEISGHETTHGNGTVLFDCYNGLGLGGVEAWTMDLCSALIRQGYDNIYIISDNKDYELPGVLRNHVLPVDIDHDRHYSRDTVSGLVETIMDKAPCRVVTCTVNEVMLAAYIIKKRYPDMVKIISVIHNSREDFYAGYLDFKECTGLYIGVSQDIRNDMIARGISQERIYAMTCPFECDGTLHRNYTENQFLPIRIGYAGRMEYVQKRMDLILKLIDELLKRHIGFVMEFAGDGAARPEMERFAAEHKLGENMKFPGRLERSKIKEFWRRQDICVNLADYEGRSISIIEAMGNGAVPVVTATSGVKEDIADGMNGYIVPLGDYGAAADRIEYMSNHRMELQKMGRLAHDAVYPKSSMETHLKFWEQILSL